jgi:hypothetical protein
MSLLAEKDVRILESSLANPRLRESDLLTALRRTDVHRELMEAVAASSRWTESYAVRFALALEPRCPLGVALAQLSSLTKRDLLRVAGTKALVPLVQAAAKRVAEEKKGDGGTARKRS